MSIITSIKQWHEAARPKPTCVNLTTQAGVHIEEVAEMLQSLHPSRRVTMALQAMTELANAWKSGEETLLMSSRLEMLDSLADQIVTAVGVAHCAKMEIKLALAEVNNSNWSKFVNGKPLFNEQGKIIKGPDYFKPDLEGMY